MLECLKEDEYKIALPISDPKMGEFLGIEETIRFISIRGYSQEKFFNYGYGKKVKQIVFL